MFGKNEPANNSVLESNRLEQSKLASALEDIARHNDRQSGGAQEKAQPAECLKDGKVCVLDRIEFIQPACSGNDLQPTILQSP